MKNALLLIPASIILLFLYSCEGEKSTQTAIAKNDSLIKEKNVSEAKMISMEGLNFGRYGCTASKYINGYYEYTPRGFFTISKEGKYLYEGFENPGNGTFEVDDNGNLYFKSGYFEGGKAEKTGRPDQFFLAFPSNPDNRWTCTLVNPD